MPVPAERERERELSSRGGGRQPRRENRDGGGAPGGAARPKQAVRASGSSVARATPEAWAGGNIRPRGVAHDPGASRRSTRNARGFSCEWLFVTVALAKLGRAGAARMEDHVRYEQRQGACRIV